MGRENRKIDFADVVRMIGRKKEQEELLNLYNSNKAELVAVYGRRRVGKTYLIGEVFKDKFYFNHSGLSLDENDESKKTQIQLEHFVNSLLLYGAKIDKKVETWFDAFFCLTKFILNSKTNEKKVIFIDELPYLDTRGSNFISAFEGFWNTFACFREDILLIVCGSATSWIENNLLSNAGGLYGRVTYEIKLRPFTLAETKEFLESKHFNYSLYDITQSYMIFGGIPYYLNYLDNKISLTQNIENLFFKNNALLSLEFDRLFKAIFTFSDIAKEIFKILSTNSVGFTRKEIAKKVGIAEGGNLSRYLNALITSDFIIKYVPFGFSKRESYYKLIDPFCIFYVKFVLNKESNDLLWSDITTNQKFITWRGYAFENVCFNHIEQIKFALGISGVSTLTSAFYNKEDGYQIDLMIIRKDNIINLCEIKFYSDLVKVNKDLYLKINRRNNLISEKINKKYSIMNTLISPFGLYKNEYFYTFTNFIVLEDLFKF